jgi:Raf kinase inhibitor-like YbhB/YbcL family protein
VRKVAALAAIIAAIAIGCSDDEGTLEEGTDIQAPADITISAPFEDNGSIQPEYTCDGENISPALSWTGGQDAAEFAVTMIDPDAPSGAFVHWVLYGIEPTVDSIEQGAPPPAALEGANSSGDVGYTGPCPPEGDDPHRYVFTVYALDEKVSDDLATGATADELLSAIECCVRSQGSLTGTYGR